MVTLKDFIYKVKFILIPRAAILLASTTDRELSQGPKEGSPRITDLTVAIGYKNGQLLRLRILLAPARALDPWCWPKGSQLWGREWVNYYLEPPYTAQYIPRGIAIQ